MSTSRAWATIIDARPTGVGRGAFGMTSQVVDLDLRIESDLGGQRIAGISPLVPVGLVPTLLPGLPVFVELDTEDQSRVFLILGALFLSNALSEVDPASVSLPAGVVGTGVVQRTFSLAVWRDRTTEILIGITLKVTAPDGRTFIAENGQAIPPGYLPVVVPGARFAVRGDPVRPDFIFIDWSVGVSYP